MTEPVDPDLTPEESAAPATLSYSSPPTMITGVGLALVLLVSAMFGWWALGPEIRSQITWFQAATLLFIVLLMVVIMLSIGYSRLWAADGVVTVRNGPFVRRYNVEDIAGVRLRSGDAWSSLLLKEEGALKRRPMLAIQFLEGESGKRKIAELRRWLKANGATSVGFTSADAD